MALLPLASVVAIATPRSSDPLLAQIPSKPPGDGEPDDTASGASQPNLRLCPEDAAAPSHPLTVLRPQISSAIQLDRTLTARPTLVAYLPATEARELPVRLYARDAEADYDYSTTVKLTAAE